MKPQWNLQETINSILMKHSFCHFLAPPFANFGVAQITTAARHGEKKRRLLRTWRRGDIVGSENQLGHSITMEMFHWRIWVNRTIIVRLREIIPFLWPQDSGERFFFNNLPRTIYKWRFKWVTGDPQVICYIAMVYRWPILFHDWPIKIPL